MTKNEAVGELIKIYTDPSVPVTAAGGVFTFTFGDQVVDVYKPTELMKLASQLDNRINKRYEAELGSAFNMYRYFRAHPSVLSTVQVGPHAGSLPDDLKGYDRFLAAIRTKPFILLAGISGTGKSRMVRQLARGFCPKMGEATSEQPVRGAWVPDVPKMKVAWDAFLEKWPIEKLSTMTLEEYSAVGKKDSFCYDLEHKATVGSIKGNTSFKFGIYEYGQMPKAQKGQKADDRYAWYEKHGATREEAWENIRKIIVDVATAAREGKVSDVDAADLAPMVKWKIAFLYQDQNKPQVLNYFSPDVVKNMTAALGDNEPMSRRYEHLLAQRSADVNLLQYGADCYNQFLANEQAESKSTGASSVSTSQTDAWNFLLIPVRPNWHDSTELMGYVTRITEDGKPEYVLTPFVRFLAKAWMNPEVPFFLCLDEMNLAPVEQYFAEYLSAIESRKWVDASDRTKSMKTDVVVRFGAEMPNGDVDPFVEETVKRLLPDYETAAEGSSVKVLGEAICEDCGIRIPPNLVVMGTVNMDETTCSFSRKVLDRAMTFELNDVSNMYTVDEINGEGDIAFGSIDAGLAKCSWLGAKDAVNSDVGKAEVDSTTHETVAKRILDYIKAINDQLENTPFKIAYRSRDEIIIYCLERIKSGVVGLPTALDEATSMKILSRIEGDDQKLLYVGDNPAYKDKTILDALKGEIAAALRVANGGTEPTDCTVCAKKLDFMARRLDGGFTNFFV